MRQKNLVIASLESYLENYIDLCLVRTRARYVSNRKRRILKQIVDDPRKANLLLSVLAKNGLGLKNLSYKKKEGIFSIGTDMDYAIARRIKKENDLENIAVSQVITEDEFTTYIRFEAPYYPDAVFLIGEYIDRFKRK